MKYYLVLFLFIITCVHYAIQIKPQNRSNFLSNNKNSCDLCLEKTGDICSKCIKGAYLYNHECYFTCPGETLADNYSLTCKKESESPVFIKAYTLGRCMNKCGSIFHDCSCDVRCKKAGDCCSDFKYCEYIGKEASKQCTIVGCEACTQNTCLKCNDGLFYYKNQCVNSCPNETRTIPGNSLCIDIPKCKIDNCAECDKDNSNSKCSKCIHGFFLHENECSEFCPAGTRANRVDFTCVNKSTFAFSMIFPSKFSCKSQCGLEKTKLRKINNISLEKNCQIENNEHTKQDCSCHHNCLKDGNCCDDFETECLDELKKEKCKTCETCHEGKCLKCLENSELHQGDCNCRKGFYYDIEKDRCLDINSKIIKSDKEKLQASKTSENSNSILSKMLADSFHSPNTEDSFKQSFAMPGLGYNMVLSGNTTMNIFSGNDHPIITNESVVNENSFNNSTKIEKNINSHNIIIRGYNSEYTSVEDSQYGNPQNYNNGIGIEAPPNQSYKYPRYKTSISPDSQGGTIQRKLSNRQSERKKKIIIDKHFHMDHNKNYPEDLEHEEGSPITMKELLKNSYNKSKKKIISEPKVLVVKPNKANNAPQQETVSVKSATGAKQMKVKNSSQFAAPAAVKFGNLDKDDKLEPDNLQIITPVPTATIATSSNNQISFSDQNKILSPSLTLDDGKPSIQKKHNTLLKEILSEKKPTLEISNPPLGNNSISEKINKNPEEEKENPIAIGSIMGNSENQTNIDNIPLSKLKNKNLDHLVETSTDANKKIQVNINIPNASVDDKNPNVLHRNRVVVYNHYFINDKSMTMHQPKNPNVFNFFGNECKDGKCVNSDEIKSLKNAKFIDDKNFHEFNSTLNVQKSGVNLILDRGSSELKLPESQKKEISEFPNEIKQGPNRLKRVIKK